MAEEELLADACEMLLKDSQAVRELLGVNLTLGERMAAWIDKFAERVKQAYGETYRKEAAVILGDVENAQKIWDAALKEAVQNRAEGKEKAATEGGVKMSVRPIIGQSGTNYGNGVYLDSTLLEGLTEDERVEMVKERIKELGGQVFTAYDGAGNEVQIRIAMPSQRFRNENGKRVRVNKDLTEKYNRNPVKQEAVVLVDELISTAQEGQPNAARYAHGWLDNYGQSPWVKWSTYIQEKNGNVWIAYLNVATAADGTKHLYDVDPIKIVEQAGTSATSPQQQKSAVDKIAQEGGEVKRNSEREAETQERFSLRDPVERTDRLIAWHNMNADALRSALELGGLAMPSWAIKTADRAHTSYGDISVIAPRSLVDPKQNRNSMIFGGDAWTPVFPEISYKVSNESAGKLESEIRDLVGENVYRQIGGAALDADNISNQLRRSNGDLPGHYRESLLMKYAYLRSQGKNIDLPTTEAVLDGFGYFANDVVRTFADKLTWGGETLKKLRSMGYDELMQQEDVKQIIRETDEERYRKKMGEDLFQRAKEKGLFSKEISFSKIDAMLRAAAKYFEQGVEQTVDKRAAQEIVDKEIDKAGFEKWALEKLNGTVEKKGIRNEKDMFTPSGNRRSFDALHYEYNLANIVKAMKAQPKQGSTQFLSGPGSIRGAALKSYNTVEQVRAERGRLVDTAAEAKAAYDAYDQNVTDILHRMTKKGNILDASDALIEILQHAKTETGIYNYMQRELADWYHVSHNLAHDIYNLIGQINALPMEYFEGKTYDAMDFAQAAAVVVPDNLDQSLVEQLVEAGANVVEYKAGDNADRLEKVNSVEGAKFSEREDLPGDEELLMGADPALAEDPEQAKILREYQKRGEKIRSLEQRVQKLEGEIRGMEGDNPARISLDRFRSTLADAFGISKSRTSEIGAMLDAVANSIINGGKFRDADVDWLLEDLLREGKGTVEPGDQVLGEIRQQLRGERIYVSPEIKAEFGDDWSALKKRAFAAGIYLTNNQKDAGIDVVNNHLAESFPGSFDSEGTDLGAMLENMVELAESGRSGTAWGGEGQAQRSVPAVPWGWRWS